MSEPGPRFFVASRDEVHMVLGGSEQQLRHMGVSPALSAAYDILADNGDATEDLVRLCAVAERKGRDPEAFARHLVKLRRVVKEHR